MAAVSTHQVGDVVVVSFQDATFLDTETIERVGKELLETTLAAAVDKKLVLSFRNVRFMSSSMLNKVINLHKKCQKDGVKLKICSLSDDIRKVFEITRLNKLIEIQADEESAVKSFDKRGWFG